MGHLMESGAKLFLMAHGLSFLERNYRCQAGEIDLIMRHTVDGRQQLVFVEVRFRRSTAHGHPNETVGADKRNRIRRTAEYYLMSHPGLRFMTMRFDLVAICWRNYPRISWLQGAFE